MNIRCWNLIDYSAGNHDAVVKICDQLNAKWKWICFYTDTSDYSVTASMDQELVDDPSMGAAMWEAFSDLDSVLAAAYDDLLPYAKN